MMTKSCTVTANHLTMRHNYFGMRIMGRPDPSVTAANSTFPSNFHNITNEPTPTASLGNQVLMQDTAILNFSGDAISSRGGEVVAQNVIMAHTSPGLNYASRGLRNRDEDDDSSYLAASHLTVHDVENGSDNNKSTVGSLMSIKGAYRR